jgi:phospholipid transport system substrate-binding protein
MVKQLTFILVLTLAISTAPVGATEGSADPAAQQIEKFYAALTQTMKQGKELGLQGRYKKLAPVVEETFDLPTMAQLTVGPAWAMMSEQDRGDIDQAFERLTVANYAKNFASYEGQKFSVDPDVKMRNDDKIVETKLIGADGKTIPFNYRMHMVDGKWKILDIYLNGYVSQIALRRSDFASTVASAGAPGLVKRINDLVDKQLAGG